jgi:hypothetical protein
MFMSFTRIAVLSCALASIVACSAGSEDVGSTSEALHVNLKCPPSVVPGDPCDHPNETCYYSATTCSGGGNGPYVTCEKTGKGTYAFSRPFCTLP